VLEETQDAEELIERVAALDIGKAELTCCVRVPSPSGCIASTLPGWTGWPTCPARARPGG
jgi:hypothetical protein